MYMLIKKRYLVFFIIFTILILSFVKYAFFRQDLYFWKIEANDKTVYLLGTLHAFNPELFEIDTKIIDSFYSSEIVLFESIYQGVDGYYYPSGDSLKNHLTEADYKKLSELLADNGLDIKDYKNYKTRLFWLKMSSFGLARSGISYYEDYGIDDFFRKKCRLTNIPFDGLECTFRNTELMEEGFTERARGYFLINSTKNFLEGENFVEDIDLLIEQWLDGTYVYSIGRASLEDPPECEIEREIVSEVIEGWRIRNKKRNIEMADTIERYIEKEEESIIFAMAGIAHFVGENSIIEILKERGYKARQVKKSINIPFIN